VVVAVVVAAAVMVVVVAVVVAVVPMPHASATCQHRLLRALADSGDNCPMRCCLLARWSTGLA